MYHDDPLRIPGDDAASWLFDRQEAWAAAAVGAALQQEIAVKHYKRINTPLEKHVLMHLGKFACTCLPSVSVHGREGWWERKRKMEGTGKQVGRKFSQGERKLNGRKIRKRKILFI